MERVGRPKRSFPQEKVSKNSIERKNSGGCGVSVDSNPGMEEERDNLRGTVEDMPDKMDDSTIPAVVNARFQVGKKVGSGSYGSVFMAVDLKTNEKVALKIESNKALKQKRKQLLHELLLYKQLQGGVGIPKVVWFGSDKALRGRQTLALELMGPSLSDLLKRSRMKRFSVDTVMTLAPQLIDRIEFCHSRGLIHRDIKPNNFVLGVGKKSRRVHIIDFGLSTRYWKPGSRKHIEYEDGKRLTGTARYASVNNHIGVHHSRRDDLECLGFVMIYLIKGRLPWQGIRAKTKARKFSKIKRKKIETPNADLCHGLPSSFLTYMDYCKCLEFSELPDYAYLRSLFWNALERRGTTSHHIFEWEADPDIYGYTATLNLPNENSKPKLSSADQQEAAAAARAAKVAAIEVDGSRMNRRRSSKYGAADGSDKAGGGHGGGGGRGDEMHTNVNEEKTTNAQQTATNPQKSRHYTSVSLSGSPRSRRDMTKSHTDSQNQGRNTRSRGNTRKSSKAHTSSRHVARHVEQSNANDTEDMRAF